jgi:hypothetical protein
MASEQMVVDLFMKLWAVPGMPEYLLTEPLTSYSRRNIDVKLARGETITKKDRKRRWADKTAYEFAYLLFNILVRTAVGHVQPSMMSTNDGYGRLRQTPVAKAATERALELWFDRFVMKDCGDALAPGASFAYTVITTNMSRCHELLEKGLGLACISQVRSGLSPSIPAKVLKEIPLREWTQISEPCALDMLCSLYIILGEREGYSDFGGKELDLKPVFFKIMGAILSPSTRRVQLCNAAATHRQFATLSQHQKKVPEEAYRFYAHLAEQMGKAKDPMAVALPPQYEAFQKVLRDEALKLWQSKTKDNK